MDALQLNPETLGRKLYETMNPDPASRIPWDALTAEQKPAWHQVAMDIAVEVVTFARKNFLDAQAAHRATLADAVEELAVLRKHASPDVIKKADQELADRRASRKS